MIIGGGGKNKNKKGLKLKQFLERLKMVFDFI